MIGEWRGETFLVAQILAAPVRRQGYTWKGIGVFESATRDWRVIHLGSGHLICALQFPSEMPNEIAATSAQIIATEIAMAGDWTFTDLTGWAVADPKLPERIRLMQGIYEGFIYGGIFGANAEAARSVRRANGDD